MQALIILLDFVHICLLKFNIITLSNLERGYILSRPVFLKSGQLVTCQTSLIYKGNDGTSRIINPDNYQPKGNYAAANHNHNGVYQPAGSYAAANHNHNGVYQPVGSYATTAQLNEVKTSVSNGKSAVASAITDKGVSTSATASFNTMANNIRSINTMPSLLGTWKFNDVLQFTTTEYSNMFPTNSITYTFTTYDNTHTGIQLEIGFYQGAYVVKCYINPGSFFTIYNSTYDNKWYKSSQYITITSVQQSDYVEKYVLSMLLPFATKV